MDHGTETNDPPLTSSKSQQETEAGRENGSRFGERHTYRLRKLSKSQIVNPKKSTPNF